MTGATLGGMAAAGLAASAPGRLGARLEAQSRDPGGPVLRVALGTPAVCPDALREAAERAGMPPGAWRVTAAPGPGIATVEAVVEARRGPPGDGAAFVREAAAAGRPAEPGSETQGGFGAGILGGGRRAAGTLAESLSAPPGRRDAVVRRTLAGLAAAFAGVSCGAYGRGLGAMPLRLRERSGGIPRADALCLLAARAREMPPEGAGASLDLLPPRLSGTGEWVVAGLAGPDDPRTGRVRKLMASMPPVRPGGFPEPLDELSLARLGRWASGLLAAAGWPQAPAGAVALTLARECGIDPVADPRAPAWLAGVAEGAPQDAADALLATEASCGAAAAGLLRMALKGRTL